MEKSAAILVVGNEILTGKVEETNARYLSSELFQLGVRLDRILVIPDHVDEIATAVTAMRADVDHLFTSGGVGPTHDDLTIAGVAKALGRSVVRVPVIAEVLKRYYGDRCTDDVLRMAEAPDGYELLDCGEKHWPVLSVENVVILPGVPEVFRRKFDGIRERFRTSPFSLESVYLALEEGLVVGTLNLVIARFADVTIGSYPTFTDPDYKVKITFESKNAPRVAEAAAHLRSLLPEGALVLAPKRP